MLGLSSSTRTGLRKISLPPDFAMPSPSSTTPDLKQTVQAIRDAAEEFRRKATELDRQAKTLEETGELDICGEVIATCASACANLRLDLIVNRPLRELERKLYRAQQDHQS